MSSPGKNIIPGEDSRTRAPFCIQGWDTSAQHRSVDQIIVDKSGGMEHLDGGGQIDAFFVICA